MNPLVALPDLPENWQRAVCKGALSLPEASELWMMLESATMSDAPWISPPDHLEQAVNRLLLWQLECEPMRH